MAGVAARGDAAGQRCEGASSGNSAKRAWFDGSQKPPVFNRRSPAAWSLRGRCVVAVWCMARRCNGRKYPRIGRWIKRAYTLMASSTRHRWKSFQPALRGLSFVFDCCFACCFSGARGVSGTQAKKKRTRLSGSPSACPRFMFMQVHAHAIRGLSRDRKLTPAASPGIAYCNASRAAFTAASTCSVAVPPG